MSRNSLGGINAVDIQPWKGSMMGTIVKNNLINSKSAFIKIAMAVGPLAWMDANQFTNNTDARIYGAAFIGNKFVSLNDDGSLGSGYFGYGLCASFIHLTAAFGWSLIIYKRTAPSQGQILSQSLRTSSSQPILEAYLLEFAREDSLYLDRSTIIHIPTVTLVYRLNQEWPLPQLSPS
jgi:hypothetical protein